MAEAANIATLPPEVTARLLDNVDQIARRMTRRIAEENVLPPQVSRLGYLKSVTIACRDAAQTLLRLLRDGLGLRSDDLQRLGSMGAQQAEMGVPLEVLLSAYRLAARVVWEDVIGDAVRRDELSPTAVVSATALVLEYLDLISGAVGAAYLETRERLMRQRDRDRDRILQRLLAGDAPQELHHQAAAVDLTLQPPYQVVVMSVSSPETAAAVEEAWRALGALVVTDEPGTAIALVHSRTQVGKLARDIEKATEAEVIYGVGPTAESLADVASSAQHARDTLSVGRRLDPATKVHHEADLGVFAAMAKDQAAIARFVDRTLGPLAHPRNDRDRHLLATADVIINSRSASAAATALHVHRHTVVYRLGKLAELGMDVDDPTERQQLWLALRARRLLDSEK